jgi:hypothetical protein
MEKQSISFEGEDYEEIDFDNFLSSQLDIEFSKKNKDSSNRFETFVNHFKNHFIKSKYREIADILIISQFKGATFSYIYNEQSFVYINLYSTLEWFSMETSIRLLSKSGISKDSIEKLLQRKNLVEFAELLFRENIINKTDLKFIENLSKIRNSIAHKNLTLLGKYFASGNKINPYEADEIVKSKDPLDFIMKSVDIFIKITLSLIEKK